ncbi:MAG: signaling recognition particle receptor family protein, partial [Gammaproteobacteria bacterium]|nr:signaling recognition particle receptor family protein [Gammaproteobacteria bacterium]
MLADVGVEATTALIDELRQRAKRRANAETPLKTLLRDSIVELLAPLAVPLDVDAGPKPFVVLVVGVNGTGKTTTIGKLAHWLIGNGKRVVLCAGDTFRAAAIEQLQLWGERAGVPVVAGQPGADAAGLAYDALARARDDGADVLLIDTAGRLHTKADLMAELGKIRRVLAKLDPTAPHDVVLVLDATTG